MVNGSGNHKQIVNTVYGCGGKKAVNCLYGVGTEQHCGAADTGTAGGVQGGGGYGT